MNHDGPVVLRRGVSTQIPKTLNVVIRGICLVMLAAGLWSAQAVAEEEFPKSRALVRSMLEQANDVALQAQERYFPEHYDALITQLVELQRKENSREASEALVIASNQNWVRYNELVRQGSPEDWRQLVSLRRDMFALIAQHDGAQQCLSYEYEGTQALTRTGNEVYRVPVSVYIAKFLETAAHAREEAQSREDVQLDDMALLYETARARGMSPELLGALRPQAEAHPQFCEAMIAMLDAAQVLEGEPGARIWRFLVTLPINEEAASPPQ